MSFCTLSSSREDFAETILESYNIDYSNDEKNLYLIPGLNTTYVPQGLCLARCGEKMYRLISAYDSEKKNNSCIYIIDKNGEYKKTLYLNDSIGVHVGGITADNNSNVYVCDSKNGTIRVYDSNEIYMQDDKTTINQIANYKVDIIPSCISYNKFDNSIYVATFNKDCTSTLTKYSLDLKRNEDIIAIPPKIQGITFLSNGEIVLSQSYGIANDSTLLIGKINNKEFVCDRSIILPPCSEEIYATENDNIFVLFESAAKKFKCKKRMNKVILIKI